MLFLKIIHKILMVIAGIISGVCAVQAALGTLVYVLCGLINVVTGSTELPAFPGAKIYFLSILGLGVYPLVAYGLPAFVKALVESLPDNLTYFIDRNRFVIYSILVFTSGIFFAYIFWK